MPTKHHFWYLDLQINTSSGVISLRKCFPSRTRMYDWAHKNDVKPYKDYDDPDTNAHYYYGVAPKAIED